MASRSIFLRYMCKPISNGLFPLNIQIKDPLWPQRNLADFSFSIKPEEPRTIWFDTRDRILPAGRRYTSRLPPQVLTSVRLRSTERTFA